MMRTVLVVGGNSPMADATARRLLADGCTVIVTSHKGRARVDQLAKEFPERVRILSDWDICDDNCHQRLRDVLTELAPGLAAVANFASYSEPGMWNTPPLAVTPAALRNTFEVEVVGTHRLFQSLDVAASRSPIGVVLFGSAGSLTYDADTYAYNIAKAGTTSLGLHLAKALAPHVRVNVVAPGSVGREWIDRWNISSQEVQAFRAVRGGQRRLGRYEEAAELIRFLLSDQAAYISGQVICLDGGSSV